MSRRRVLLALGCGEETVVVYRTPVLELTGFEELLESDDGLASVRLVLVDGEGVSTDPYVRSCPCEGRTLELELPAGADEGTVYALVFSDGATVGRGLASVSLSHLGVVSLGVGGLPARCGDDDGDGLCAGDEGVWEDCDPTVAGVPGGCDAPLPISDVADVDVPDTSEVTDADVADPSEVTDADVADPPEVTDADVAEPPEVTDADVPDIPDVTEPDVPDVPDVGPPDVPDPVDTADASPLGPCPAGTTEDDVSACSCDGLCGQHEGQWPCVCDADCVQFSDCCPDYVLLCL